MSNLGNRIKQYEAVMARQAMPRMPVMIRVDGRDFHTFTRMCGKPFDKSLMQAMVVAAKITAFDMQGFKCAYVQSDEASFVLTDYDTLETQGWFGYDLNKLISISAATMSVEFNRFYSMLGNVGALQVFDSRVFNVPKEDVVNALLWRAQDWQRNSLQMYCRSFFHIGNYIIKTQQPCTKCCLQ
jgi:tRNA(His) 5'-end guanylyltransferase